MQALYDLEEVAGRMRVARRKLRGMPDHERDAALRAGVQAELDELRSIVKARAERLGYDVDGLLIILRDYSALRYRLHRRPSWRQLTKELASSARSDAQTLSHARYELEQVQRAIASAERNATASAAAARICGLRA